jgi:hypothetical protein
MRDSRHGAELAAAIWGENFDLRLEEYVASRAVSSASLSSFSVFLSFSWIFLRAFLASLLSNSLPLSYSL